MPNRHDTIDAFKSKNYCLKDVAEINTAKNLLSFYWLLYLQHMEKVLLQLRIKGRVQGVYYRASAKSKADELGLCGWVKNEPNGDVSVIIEGPPELVAQMVSWCQSGPRMAKVEQVEQQPAPLKYYQNFTILRWTQWLEKQ